LVSSSSSVCPRESSPGVLDPHVLRKRPDRLVHGLHCPQSEFLYELGKYCLLSEKMRNRVGKAYRYRVQECNDVTEREEIFRREITDVKGRIPHQYSSGKPQLSNVVEIGSTVQTKWCVIISAKKQKVVHAYGRPDINHSENPTLRGYSRKVIPVSTNRLLRNIRLLERCRPCRNADFYHLIRYKWVVTLNFKDNSIRAVLKIMSTVNYDS
ncbi:unnamed protein product, partial [Nesidiocoris tenuis]